MPVTALAEQHEAVHLVCTPEGFHEIAECIFSCLADRASGCTVDRVLSTCVFAASGRALPPHATAGGKDRAGEKSSAKSRRWGHESSVGGRSRSAIGAPAAADVLRDCDPRQRPGLRVWQQIATAALHVC